MIGKTSSSPGPNICHTASPWLTLEEIGKVASDADSPAYEFKEEVFSYRER